MVIMISYDNPWSIISSFAVDDIWEKYLFLFAPKKVWYFMWLKDSHKILSLIAPKIKKDGTGLTSVENV